MKKILILLFLLTTLVSYGQYSIDTSSYFIYDSITNSSTDWSRYPGMFDSIPATTLKFDTIIGKEFSEYRKNYHLRISTDSSRLFWTDSSFVINTSDWKKEYNTKVSDDNPFNYYLGFLEPLNLFIVSNIDGRNELGTLMLIDRISGKEFIISSGYDYPCEALLISPKNNFVLSYANNWAEHNQSMLVLYRIVRTKNHYRLKAYCVFESEQWTINEIAWINENNFALSVKTKTDLSNYNKNNGEDHYLKASFKK